MAGGTGAVGPSLAGLTRLQRLTIALSHTHELFIVKHPHVEWAALRALSALRTLRIHHLCTFSFLPTADGWSGDTPVSVEAEQLLGALPCIQELELRCACAGRPASHAAAMLRAPCCLRRSPHRPAPRPGGAPRLPPIPRCRLSFCRLRDEDAGADGAVSIPHPSSALPRRFQRTTEAAAIRAPGRRHDDAWFEQWWQAPVQRGRDAMWAEHFLSQRGEVAGWMALRPGNFLTFDVLVRYCLLQAAGAGAAGSPADEGDTP